MSTVKDADGNVLNRTAPQIGNRYTDESALTQDWFAKHPRPVETLEIEREFHPSYVDENDKTWLYNPETKKWDIPEVKVEFHVPAVPAVLPSHSGSTLVVTDEAPRSSDDVPSVQLPSGRSDDGLVAEPALSEPTVPSEHTAGDVSVAPLEVPLY